MLYCASIAFLSRPESVAICMTDEDFARVVGDKNKRRAKGGETKTKEICDWRKINYLYNNF
jgi:hypothetical protein